MSVTKKLPTQKFQNIKIWEAKVVNDFQLIAFFKKKPIQFSSNILLKYEFSDWIFFQSETLKFDLCKVKEKI